MVDSEHVGPRRADDESWLLVPTGHEKAAGRCRRGMARQRPGRPRRYAIRSLHLETTQRTPGRRVSTPWRACRPGRQLVVLPPSAARLGTVVVDRGSYLALSTDPRRSRGVCQRRRSACSGTSPPGSSRLFAGTRGPRRFFSASGHLTCGWPASSAPPAPPVSAPCRSPAPAPAAPRTLRPAARSRPHRCPRGGPRRA